MSFLTGAFVIAMLLWLLAGRRFLVRVPPNHAAVAEYRTYTEGTHVITSPYRLVNLQEQIQTYTIDDAGYYRLVNQSAISPADRNRYVIVWRPDLRNLRQFDAAGTPQKIAEILQTHPDVDLAKYGAHLGIEVLSVDRYVPVPAKRAAQAVELGDGLEIPY